MDLLEKAIQIAVEAHNGQKDKAAKPYILHPLRVMFKMQNENEMISAVLHDVVEDTHWTIESLRSEGFNNEILEAVNLLTKTKKISENEYFVKIKSNKIALKVKLADLEDNMDLKRIAHPGFKDYARLAKYIERYNELMENE